MKLNDENLEKLYNYFLKGGSVEYADVGKFLNLDPKKNKLDIDQAIDDLRVKYPNLKEDVAVAREKENVPVVKEKPQEPVVEKISKVTLLDPTTNLGEELEIVMQGKGKVVVRKIVPPEPKDEVTIKLKGEDVVVDVIQLQKLDKAEVMHGLNVATLLILAASAR